MEDPLVTFEITGKGKPMVWDSNNYTYVAKASSTAVKYWKCLIKMCSARIRTRISSSNLIGTVLPEHLHENRLLKQAIRKQENSIIKKMAKVDGISNTRVISEITSNIQRSDTPMWHEIKKCLEGCPLERAKNSKPYTCHLKDFCFIHDYQFSWKVLEYQWW